MGYNPTVRGNGVRTAQALRSWLRVMPNCLKASARLRNSPVLVTNPWSSSQSRPDVEFSLGDDTRLPQLRVQGAVRFTRFAGVYLAVDLKSDRAHLGAGRVGC